MGDCVLEQFAQFPPDILPLAGFRHTLKSRKLVVRVQDLRRHWRNDQAEIGRGLEFIVGVFNLISLGDGGGCAQWPV